MKKGVVFPIVGMIVIILSIVVMIVITSTGDTFTKRVILKGEVAASNLNEIEGIRKMLPVAMEPIAQRVTYELGKNGGGYQSPDGTVGLWTATAPTDEFLESELAYTISLKMPGSTSGNYDRSLSFAEKNIEVTKGTEAFTVTGYQTFVLEDDIIRSEATINVLFDEDIESSYFELIDIGQSLFTETTYQDIINSNQLASDRASELQDELSDDYLDLEFEVSTTSDTSLMVSIKDPNTLVPRKPGETVDSSITGPFNKLNLIFKIEIPPLVIITDKEHYVNPDGTVYLTGGWQYTMTPFINAVTGSDITSCIDMVCTTENCFTDMSSIILEPDVVYYVHATSECTWYGDYVY